MKKNKKTIAHFSCGVTSAVTAMICHLEGDLDEVAYADPNAEHKDNHRFMRDFEKLTGLNVVKVKSKTYKSIFEVFDKKQYLVGIQGAPCTTEMKKIPMTNYLGERLITRALAFGYTPDEPQRVKRFEDNNPEVTLRVPLIENDLSKQDCFYIMAELGLKLPKMYMLGYSNANCIGCVKARSPNYWKAIKEDFPDVFDWYAKKEREVGAKDEDGNRKGIAICRYQKDGERINVYLDELDEKCKHIPTKRNISISCGYTCGMQDNEETYSTNQLVGQPSFNGYFWANKLKEFYGVK